MNHLVRVVWGWRENENHHTKIMSGSHQYFVKWVSWDRESPAHKWVYGAFEHGQSMKVSRADSGLEFHSVQTSKLIWELASAPLTSRQKKLSISIKVLILVQLNNKGVTILAHARTAPGHALFYFAWPLKTHPYPLH